MALIEITRDISALMDEIKEMFKSPNKIAVIVIPPKHSIDGDTDFMLTDVDDLDDLIEFIKRRKGRG